LRLVADRLEPHDALLQRQVGQIGDAGLDRVLQPLEPEVGFGRPFVQFGDVLAAASGVFVPAVEDGRQYFLEPLRWSKRLTICSATRLSSLSIGIDRPLQPVSPWRALIEQV
jgi:hypothetical protein